MIKPIFISLSPNTEKDDILLALRLIFQPGKWRVESKGRKAKTKILERHIRNYIGVKYAFVFNSGRASFLAILQSLDLEKGSEILVQGFTCNALINPIIWSGFNPIYVDIKKNTLNIDPEKLKKKIGPKTKAVVVQHTFGLPADIDKILEICKHYNLILIEDCAHSLGATYKDQKIGTFGKVAFFSFGRDKVISSVSGGMAVTNDPGLAKKIMSFQQKMKPCSLFWTFQQLLHPVLINFLIKPLYGLYGTGRWALVFLLRSKILSKSVDTKEKQGKRTNYLFQRMPNALAILAIHQFKKIDKIIKHQREIALLYDKSMPYKRRNKVLLPKKQKGRIYMRYSLIFNNNNTDRLLSQSRKEKIFLNDGWRKTVIVPLDTDQEKMNYIKGLCPVAETVAKNILNLPTHINISKDKAKRIIKFLWKFDK